MFDLPEPLGPTMAEKDLWKGPMGCRPAYDLKFSSTICEMMSRFWGPGRRAGSGGEEVRCEISKDGDENHGPGEVGKSMQEGARQRSAVRPRGLCRADTRT